MEKQPTKNRLIKIALYKNSKSFFGKLIRFQQYSLQKKDWKHAKYSHAEIVFCGLKNREKIKFGRIWIQGFEKQQYSYSNDIFFSSSETDGGCRFKNIIPKKNHWDFVEIEISDEEFQVMLEKAIDLNGSSYSKWGIILAQGLNLNRSDSNRYFCSQIVSILLHEALGNDFSQSFFEKYTHFINPAKLSERLEIFTDKRKNRSSVQKEAKEFPETEFIK